MLPDAQNQTAQHLHAKAAIIAACAAAGYTPSEEAIGDGWRADVLATRGAIRIAFEVQWSFLKLRETLERQRRYARDGVRGCWFFRTPPAPLVRADGTLDARRDLPLFQLRVNADMTFNVELNGRMHPLGAFVGALLGGGVRFCETARAPLARARLVFVKVPCPRCNRLSPVYAVEPTAQAACGVDLPAPAAPFDPALTFLPEVRAAAEAYAGTHKLRMGAIKPRASLDSPPAGTTAVPSNGAPTFGCPFCDAPLTPEHIAWALYGSQALARARDTHSHEVAIQRGGVIETANAHWCYPPPSAPFCEG